jgi:hypothetical protein
LSNSNALTAYIVCFIVTKCIYEVVSQHFVPPGHSLNDLSDPKFISLTTIQVGKRIKDIKERVFGFASYKHYIRFIVTKCIYEVKICYAGSFMTLFVFCWNFSFLLYQARKGIFLLDFGTVPTLWYFPLLSFYYFQNANVNTHSFASIWWLWYRTMRKTRKLLHFDSSLYLFLSRWTT